MMRCVKKKTEKRREGRKRLQIWLSLYNEAIWWHKSVVSEVFLQASLFISYICKVPENISVTLNRNHLLPHPLPIVIPRVGILSLLYFSAALGVWESVGATRDQCKAPSVTLMNKKENIRQPASDLLPLDLQS